MVTEVGTKGFLIPRYLYSGNLASFAFQSQIAISSPAYAQGAIFISLEISFISSNEISLMPTSINLFNSSFAISQVAAFSVPPGATSPHPVIPFFLYCIKRLNESPFTPLLISKGNLF